ncbi:MAG: MFS transporter [Gammaproteobacteria bacterium]|nr:MFS transporter [Gammaproteobacteria bacterium]
MIDKTSPALSMQQPPELYNIFVIELWERFAYYGVQILLVFFIADYLHLSRIETIELNGAFIALVYASPIFGGYLADRVLGVKRTLIMGASLLALGYIFLAAFAVLPPEYFSDPKYYLVAFYWALGCIAIGNGCFKPNPTSLLSKVYSPNDPRIDAGYTIFYMSINIGSLFSMILTPIIQAKFGYAPAFLLCACGIIGGLAYFVTKLEKFKQAGSPADFKPLQISSVLIVSTIIVCLTIFAAFLLAHLFYAKLLIFTTVIGVVAMFAYFAYGSTQEESNKILAILILLIWTAIFFSMQFQMFGVLNMFIDQHVDRNFMGYIIPAGNYAALNGFWVAVLGPCVAKFYMYYEHRGMPLTIPFRFSLGLLISSIGFYFLSFSGIFTATGMISSWWIIISYFIISLGEILISALGFALICKLAPPKYTSVFMGACLLATAVGGWLSGVIGHWVEIPTGATDLPFMLAAYNSAFFKVANMSMVSGIVAVFLIPFLVRLTGEKKIKSSYQLA